MKSSDKIIYGKHSVVEALETMPEIVKKIVLVPQMGLNDVVIKAEKLKVPLSELSRRDFENNIRSAFEKRVNHQNIYAEIFPYNYMGLNDMLKDISEESFVIILDHITDVNNFGAILRSAVAFDVDFVIIPKDRSVEVNAAVYKTSSGCALKSKIVKVTNLNSTIKDLKNSGFWVYAADSNSDKSLSSVKLIGKSAIVLGSEGRGVSTSLLKSVDDSFKIPISSKTESLNVSVAAAVIMYHVRNFSKEIK